MIVDDLKTIFSPQNLPSGTLTYINKVPGNKDGGIAFACLSAQPRDRQDGGDFGESATPEIDVDMAIVCIGSINLVRQLHDAVLETLDDSLFTARIPSNIEVLDMFITDRESSDYNESDNRQFVEVDVELTLRYN